MELRRIFGQRKWEDSRASNVYYWN